MLLDFYQTKRILSKYKIPFCRGRIFKSKAKALNFAKKTGFPVVLKIASVDILHKTDIGGVKLGIKNEKDLKKSWNEILKQAQKVPTKSGILDGKAIGIKNEGVLVQKEIKGTEIILGMKRDEIFGPIMMFGGGGIFIELLKDVSFEICPLKKQEVKEMLKRTKVYKVLKGFRGFPRVNVEKIIKIILNLSKLSLKEKQIKEIDLNPIICNEKEVLVVDAKIII